MLAEGRRSWTVAGIRNHEVTSDILHAPSEDTFRQSWDMIGISYRNMLFQLVSGIPVRTIRENTMEYHFDTNAEYTHTVEYRSCL